MDLTRVSDALNDYFSQGETRKIVFWYDPERGFAEDLANLALAGAKLHILTPDNQFLTKHLLERQDPQSNYLCYAPFAKPPAQENALEDLWLYAKPFHADRVSMLASDLGLGEASKRLIAQYQKFFQSKERMQRLREYDLADADLETALLCALCKAGTVSFEEALRAVFAESLEENALLAEFEKYGLLPAFWRRCEEAFGYREAAPSLTRLAAALFVTCAAHRMRCGLPRAWQEFLSPKTGNAVAFLDSMRHSTVYGGQFDALASAVSAALDADAALRKLPREALLECDVFDGADELLLQWIGERLLAQDTGAALAGKDIPSICALRKKTHFGAARAACYDLLASAYALVRAAHYHCPAQLAPLLRQYVREDYQIDGHYRQFYAALDSLPDPGAYEPLRALCENIYTNAYLGRLLPAWSAALDVPGAMRGEQAQLRFYEKYIQPAKEKTVVILSDALRFEVGQALFARLGGDPNCMPELTYMLSVLPGYTQLGMAALLPHGDLALLPDGKVLVDGLPSDSTEKREAILRRAQPNSRCLRWDAVPQKRGELRALLNAMDTVYIYHDQIDARGGNAATENEVFAACAQAVEEIYALIKRLAGANVYRFIVTADHGFLYKREPFSESEKINLAGMEGAYRNRRFVVAREPVRAQGAAAAALRDVIGGEEERYVSWPAGAAVFKTQGGLGFVHGGASPQEMLVPLLRVKLERGHVETRPAAIALVSIVHRITSLAAQLEFIQREAVGSEVKAAEYRLFFAAESGERISNEQVHQADSKTGSHIFRLRFSFKNQKYDSRAPYYLLAVNTADGAELFRRQVQMDIASGDAFGLAG